MKRTLFALATFLTLALPANAVYADGLVLTYKVAEKTKYTSIAPLQPSKTRVLLESREENVAKEYVVTMLPEILDIRVGGEERLYDFTKRTYTLIDHDTKIYNVMPLHTIPLARTTQRRQVTQKAIDWENASQTGKMVKTMSGIALDVNGPLLDLDTIYGNVSDSSSSHLIHAVDTSKGRRFDSEGGQLAAFTLSDVETAPAIAATYRRFLAYGPILHPEVEKAIASAPKLFASLEYHTDDHMGRVSDATWNLEGTTPAGPAPQIPPGYAAHFSLDAEINAAMTSSHKPGPTAEYFGQQVQGFLAQNDPLRALLALHEALLSLPQEKTKELDPLTLKVLSAGGGEIVESTMLTLTQSYTTKGDLAMSNNALMSAKRAAKDYTYLLDIFRARNIRQQLAIDEKANAPFNEKEFNKSIRMDLNAITTNPWLAAVYADLGDALFEHGDSMLAWTCWQEAERLKPDIPGLKKVAELKAKAEKEFAEYF